MQNLLTGLIANRKTSAAGLLYIATMVVCEIGPVWMPAHAQQFATTEKIITGLLVAYGFISAGDAKPQNPTT